MSIFCRLSYWFIALYFVVLSLSSCQKEKTLFTKIDAAESGIDFANRIIENDTLNILDFEYVYNGGGVGIADMNGDSLPDVVFSGNQANSSLYLNRTSIKDENGSRKLHFENVSKKAGISNLNRWCSGVSIVDINADGRNDIYLTATTKKDTASRTNLLFVNQGNDADGVPMFKEMAKEYGVNDTGHSMNAAFFDYDNDGDLDLYVLTNTLESNPNQYHQKRRDGSSPTTDRLYRCDWPQGASHPVYTNVSKQAGIQIEGYGLGINICDINRDGWKDIYITNDYLTDDLMYINNHDGTFTDRASDYFKHTSNSAMGNDIADINNDGLLDIIAVDMLPKDNVRKKKLMGPNSYQTYLNNDLFGFNHQYVRNTLQLNMGNRPYSNDPVFSEISLMAGVAETDWSWTPMLADFDHDGWRDLVITNGFPRDVTDRDFAQFRAQSSTVASKEFLLEQIPVVKIANFAYKNNKDLTFADVTKNWGLDEPSFSNGAAYADLDLDGDLDVITNNINDSAFVYQNALMSASPAKKDADSLHFLRLQFKGGAYNPAGFGAVVQLFYGDNQAQVYEHSPYRGYLSSVEPIAHFGLGNVPQVKEIRVLWQNGKMQRLYNISTNQRLTLQIQNAQEDGSTFWQKPPTNYLFNDLTDSLNLKLVHKEPEYIDFNIQKLLPHKLSQYPPAVVVGDVNGDGLDDVFLGGSRFKKGIFLIQNAQGKFAQTDLLPGKDSLDKPQEDMGVLLFDADADNDLDLYIASGGYEKQVNPATFQDRLYLNDGKGKFKLAIGALPQENMSNSCVKAADYDRDGDLDLFIGGRVEPDQYPKPVNSLILRNDTYQPGKSTKNQLKFTPLSAIAGLNGLVCDALWTDYDNDGWVDLLLAGEWMPLTILKNEKGKFTNTQYPQLTAKVGFWNSLVGGDFDNDGDTDYIAGNIGLNTLFRASPQEPVSIYAADFNNDGRYDAIPMVYFPNEKGERKLVPFHGREDLIKEVIQMRARFPLYNNFAHATLDSILTPEEQKKALVLKANYCKSSYIENLGQGNFTITPLPLLAQVAPINGMIADDFDHDGNLDVLLVANDYSYETSSGRYDASNGLLLKGNGKGQFTPQTQTGFYVPFNTKGLAYLSTAQGRKLLIATQNRGALHVFGSTQKLTNWFTVQPNDAVAIIKNTDGRIQRKELYYGDSFLSQSARKIDLYNKNTTLEIFDFQGKKREVK